MSTILVIGADGYIGWPLTLDLLNKGHKVAVLDNYVRRDRVKSLGGASLTPISSIVLRRMLLKSYDNFIDENGQFSLHANPTYISSYLEEIQPDVIIHLGQQPSAAWSMIDAKTAAITQQENIIGTLNLLWAIYHQCPTTHLIKLGSMGEYGTPNCRIPEGRISKECLNFEQSNLCPMGDLLFPRTANSFYHLSKVHDTHNIEFACRTWGLTSTDIMQGIVYGITDTNPKLITRFDYDECFGTVVNRFIAQSISGHPLTIYGMGEQTRGYLHLKDSIACINLIINNPPPLGTYRTINQYAELRTINEIATTVFKVCKVNGLDCELMSINNPRTEQEIHYYETSNGSLTKMGYKPSMTLYSGIKELFSTMYQYRTDVNQSMFLPKTKWKGDLNEP